jgi:ribose transport system substrate-binding protein
VAVGASASSSGANTATSASTSTCIKASTSALSQAERPVKLTVPTQAVPMHKLAGKSVWFIATSESIPLVASISQGFTAAAKAAGLKPTIYDAKGTVSGDNEGLSEAVGQHASAIVLQAISPSLVGGPLAAAKKAHIPVIDALNGDPSDPVQAGIRTHLSFDTRGNGKVMADYILANSKCNAHIGVFTASVFQSITEIAAGIKQEMTRLCPSCSDLEQQIDPATLATSVGPLTQTVLERNPNINYMVATFDGLATYMVPAIQAVGSKVKVVGHDGVQENLQFIKKGQVQVADYAFPPNPSIGWTEIDQLGRLMAGMARAPQDQIPAQLITKSNYSASAFPNYVNYQHVYEKLWGIGG